MGVRAKSKSAVAIIASGLSLALAACGPARTGAQKAGQTAETIPARVGAAWHRAKQKYGDEIDLLQKAGEEVGRSYLERLSQRHSDPALSGDRATFGNALSLPPPFRPTNGSTSR